MKLNQSPSTEQIAYLRQRGSLASQDNPPTKLPGEGKSALQVIEDKFKNLQNFGK